MSTGAVLQSKYSNQLEMYKAAHDEQQVFNVELKALQREVCDLDISRG